MSLRSMYKEIFKIIVLASRIYESAFWILKPYSYKGYD